MRSVIRQLIRQRIGHLIGDPQGALYRAAVTDWLYAAQHYPVNDAILLNFSSGRWVTPWNSFRRRPGDIVVHATRRVEATLKAFGQRELHDMPRLWKWLLCFYRAAIETGLTMAELYEVLSSESVRAYVAKQVENPVVRRQFEQLAEYRRSDFLNQIESAENRLLPFTADSMLGRCMALGQNVVDWDRILESGTNVYVNVCPSDFLDVTQQRMAVTLLLTELTEAARRREVRTPYLAMVDEAGQFVLPEIADGLNHLRQKGVGFALAWQTLAQFKEEDRRVYGAVMGSVGTKMVFRMEHRADALELADDVFCGLAEPVTKHVAYGVAYRLLDEIRTFRASAMATGSSRATGRAHARGKGRGKGTSSGHVAGHSAGSITYAGEEYGADSVSHLDSAISGEFRSELETETDVESHSQASHAQQSTSERDQFITRHAEVVEERNRQFYTHEEQRNRAADVLMSSLSGECVIRSRGRLAANLRCPEPRPIELHGEDFERMEDLATARHAYRTTVAEDLIRRRREELLANAARCGGTKRSAAENVASSPKRRR